MGCIHSKSSAVDDSRESLSNQSSELKTDRSHDLVTEKAKDDGEHDELQVKVEEVEKLRRQKPEVVTIDDNPLAGRVPKAVEAEQVAAGWPAWLAGEAINGWIPRAANTFEKLDKIGQGTYSSVYRARDVVHNKIVAIKRVRFDHMDPQSVQFMCREIMILRRLDHPNVIKLESLIASPSSCSLYLVFEYMEHDLTGLAARPGIKFTEPQIKCYMKQLLSGLDYCHKHHILHRDIKGSNLLINNKGVLKIADFGLATSYDQNNLPLTSRVVTLWYRPPELLMGASQYGVEIDMWSTGCILGELYTGNPILAGKTEVEQLHKIFKLCGSPSEDYWTKHGSTHSAVFRPPRPYRRCINEAFKELPSAALRLLDTLLSVDPAGRGSAELVLSSEFFTLAPVACEASSLPKYPPSKEIDANLREEARRRREARPEQDQQPSQSNQDMTRSQFSVGCDQTGHHRDRATLSGPLFSAFRKGSQEPSRSAFSGLLRSRKDHNVDMSSKPAKQRYSGPISETERLRKRDNVKNWMRSMRRNPESRSKNKPCREYARNKTYFSSPVLEQRG